MRVEDIARIIYDANKAWCESNGDFSFGAWSHVPGWQRETLLNGIQFHLAQDVRPVRPSASHENWLKHKVEDGWVYGPVKDADKKEHPCMVPYDELPQDQQIKDHLFGAIVAALEPFLDDDGITEDSATI